MKNIHKSADIDNTASIGTNSIIWHQVQIREHVKIGNNCMLAKNVYIDHDVIIGNNCRIQNNASLYYKTIVEDGVFIGPYVCVTNDVTPRAVLPNGKAKKESDWKSGTVVIKEGASVGAGVIILPNVTIGKWAFVGAGSIVTKNVPDFALVYGSPSKIQGYVCKCGKKLAKVKTGSYHCVSCNQTYQLPT
jgi:acetyltransferase-like isoleucine patch superfamily enzyme